jgi:hypothetical protein
MNPLSLIYRKAGVVEVALTVQALLSVLFMAVVLMSNPPAELIIGFLLFGFPFSIAFGTRFGEQPYKPTPNPIDVLIKPTYRFFIFKRYDLDAYHEWAQIVTKYSQEQLNNLETE